MNTKRITRPQLIAACAQLSDMINTYQLQHPKNVRHGSALESLRQVLPYVTVQPEQPLLAVIWSKDDIKHALKRARISDVDGRQLFSLIEAEHDATIGVNWDVIEYHAQHYFA